jgi:hypothetical protein
MSNQCGATADDPLARAQIVDTLTASHSAANREHNSQVSYALQDFARAQSARCNTMFFI